MCKYCEGEENIKGIDDKESTLTVISGDNPYIYAYVTGNYDHIGVDRFFINFCPMCGRKLEESK